MKRCPTCNRIETTATLKFCRVDGTALVQSNSTKLTRCFVNWRQRSAREYIQPAMLTAAAASLGEIDRAIEFAQQAIDDRDPLFVLLARTWPDYNNVRSDSRFQEIASQLNLPGWHN